MSTSPAVAPATVSGPVTRAFAPSARVHESVTSTMELAGAFRMIILSFPGLSQKLAADPAGGRTFTCAQLVLPIEESDVILDGPLNAPETFEGYSTETVTGFKSEAIGPQISTSSTFNPLRRGKAVVDVAAMSSIDPSSTRVIVTLERAALH
jgi:hypothetical protein